jgi:fumarylacetoacetate (FAA) hydrolase
MKLASLKSGGRDGTLIVVNRTLSHYVPAIEIAATLQQAIDDWSNAAPRLNALYQELQDGSREDAARLDFTALASPFPRAFEFVDGSAYLPHVERVRKARGAEVPESFYEDPLMYQATSAGFIGPRDAVPVISEDYGIDFEAEVVVVTDDVPMGVDPESAAAHIQLVGLVNDVSLRNLIPGELAKGFGFLQSKPRSALSPVLVTPDELGAGRRGHAVQFRPAGGACGANPAVGRGHHRRFGDRGEPGRERRRVLPGGVADAGDHRRRRGQHALHELRRHHQDRNAG